MNDQTTTPRTLTASVTFQQLQEALQPVYELLGVAGTDIYAHPGLHIKYEGGGITFTVPADGSVELPPEVTGYRTTVGEAASAEAAIVVTIPVRGF